MKFDKKFVIEISSDLDYEKLVVNVLYEEATVAIISQEKGLDKLEIEIFSRVGNKSRNFLLDDFLQALTFAKKELCGD